MRRLHLSTGAWLFSGIVVAALIAPVGVYAAVSSNVAIGNPGDSVTATVDKEHQLLTNTVAPSGIIRILGNTGSSHACRTIYTPPTGKALVLLSVTMFIRNTVDPDTLAYVFPSSACSGAVDQFTSSQMDSASQHVYPAGLPVSKLAVDAGIGQTNAFLQVTATGYLIPASQLPPAA